jgi:hypothetical protein
LHIEESCWYSLLAKSGFNKGTFATQLRGDF